MQSGLFWGGKLLFLGGISMYERFSDVCRKVVQDSNKLAARTGSAYIKPIHILLAILNSHRGVAFAVLSAMSVDLEQLGSAVRQAAWEAIGKDAVQKLPFDSSTRKIIEHAMQESRSLRLKYVGTEHLLLGILREEHNSAAKLLRKIGMDPATTRNMVVQVLSKSGDGSTPSQSDK